MSINGVSGYTRVPDLSTQERNELRTIDVARRVLFGLGVGCAVASVIGIWALPLDFAFWWAGKDIIVIPASLLPLPFVLGVLKVVDSYFAGRKESILNPPKPPPYPEPRHSPEPSAPPAQSALSPTLHTHVYLPVHGFSSPPQPVFYSPPWPTPAAQPSGGSSGMGLRTRNDQPPGSSGVGFRWR